MTATRPPRWTEYVLLDDVLRAPRNPKNHHTEVIAASVTRFGVVELPALDERTGRLVAGHGRLDDWERRRDAGEDPPEGVTTADDGAWMVPVSRGWASRSDADAEAYLIVSNRSTELGGWDEPELAAMLAELREQDLLEFTGYDDDDIDRMATKAIEDDDPGGGGSFDPEPEDDPECVCPTCGHVHSPAPDETTVVVRDPA